MVKSEGKRGASASKRKEYKNSANIVTEGKKGGEASDRDTGNKKRIDKEGKKEK